MTITDTRLGNGVLSGNGYLFATGLLSEPEPSKPVVSELRSKSEVLEDRKKSASLKFPTFSKPSSGGKSENCGAVRSGKGRSKKMIVTSVKRTSSHPDTVKSQPSFRRKTGSPGAGVEPKEHPNSHTYKPPEEPCDSNHSNSSTFQRLHNEHFERLSRQEDRYQEIVMKRMGEEEDVLKECTFAPNASRRTSQQSVLTGNKTWERLYSTETMSTKHFHKSKEEPLPGPGSYGDMVDVTSGGVPIPSLNQARTSERSSQASSSHSVNGKVCASHGSTPSSVTSNEGRERRSIGHRGYQNTWSKLASGIPTGKAAEKPPMNHDTSRLASMGSSCLRSPRKRGVSPRATKPRLSPRSQSVPTPVAAEGPVRSSRGVYADVIVSSPSPVLPQQKVSKPRVTIDSSSPLVHCTSSRSWDKESGVGSLSVSSHADSGSEFRVDNSPAAGKCIDCGQAIPSELPYCPATGNKHNGSDTRIVRLEAPEAELANKFALRKGSVASASQSCDDTDLPTAIDRGSVPDTDDASTVRLSYSLAIRSVKNSGIGKSTRELLRTIHIPDDELSLA